MTARERFTETIMIDLIIAIGLHCARPDRISVCAQWALGMLLYQLLSGTLPFWDEGESQSPFTVMTAILGGEVTFDGPTWDAISPLGNSLPSEDVFRFISTCASWLSLQCISGCWEVVKLIDKSVSSTECRARAVAKLRPAERLF